MTMSDRIKEFAMRNNYSSASQKPTVGDTHYLNVWDDTYGSGVIGEDKFGRPYIITPNITLKVDGENDVQVRVCVFQRYTDDKNIFANTVSLPVGEALFGYNGAVKQEDIELLSRREVELVRDEFGTPRLAS